MKIQELRIGNKVSFKDTVVEIAGVSGIAYSFGAIDVTIFRGGKTEMHDLKTLSPIPLTEEILLKCGFDENMVLSTIEGEIRYYGDGDINIGGEDSCTLGMVYIAKCKYLHQLQNLYFALTGKELEVRQ